MDKPRPDFRLQAAAELVRFEIHTNEADNVAEMSFEVTNATGALALRTPLLTDGSRKIFDVVLRLGVTYTLVMSDAGGDGWNGAYVDAKIVGTGATIIAHQSVSASTASHAFAVSAVTPPPVCDVPVRVRTQLPVSDGLEVVVAIGLNSTQEWVWMSPVLIGSADLSVCLREGAYFAQMYSRTGSVVEGAQSIVSHNDYYLATLQFSDKASSTSITFDVKDDETSYPPAPPPNPPSPPPVILIPGCQNMPGYEIYGYSCADIAQWGLSSCQDLLQWWSADVIASVELNCPETCDNIDLEPVDDPSFADTYGYTCAAFASFALPSCQMLSAYGWTSGEIDAITLACPAACGVTCP